MVPLVVWHNRLKHLMMQDVFEFGAQCCSQRDVLLLRASGLGVVTTINAWDSTGEAIRDLAHPVVFTVLDVRHVLSVHQPVPQ